MKWVLFLISISANGDTLSRLGEYDTMAECFRAWSAADKKLPSPKVNNRVICVRVADQLAIFFPADPGSAMRFGDSGFDQ
ncbi:hypothetical protein [Candidatus Halocynthiibacter alkanivorans]|uniref:hypothetical protein n=1 Tax=Candidatus Halocynthiibacter alkanivorans TaxID=2267619 RepID=UPI000DF33234|nr:hypothetical protein [Candidatus Halocynthiibacter alkanivorans]